MEANDRALRPCPMCGGADLKIMGEDFKALLGGFHVYCNAPGCQCQGRHSGDRDKAVRAWNRRPSITPPDGWVLVPVVLTQEMEDAGYPADTAQEGWTAMLAARPEVPTNG